MSRWRCSKSGVNKKGAECQGLSVLGAASSPAFGHWGMGLAVEFAVAKGIVSGVDSNSPEVRVLLGGALR